MNLKSIYNRIKKQYKRLKANKDSELLEAVVEPRNYALGKIYKIFGAKALIMVKK